MHTDDTKETPPRNGFINGRLLTFDVFPEEQRDRTLVLDQHAWTGVLIQGDVRHPKVLLVCKNDGSAKPNGSVKY